MKAAYLKVGDVIVVDGERHTVREVRSVHKDAVHIRIRGRAPFFRRWSDEVEVEVERTCPRCGAPIDDPRDHTRALS